VIEKENQMKIYFLIATVVLSVGMMSATPCAAGNGGEAVFKAYCSFCHPNGGNVIDPDKKISGIKNPARIIIKIRNGGGGMPVFDTRSISDADAKLLAGYIMKTFRK
jgi:cytochrome c6